MSSILDVCVPSRRRERRRQRQLNEQLHSRFGDAAISAPNEGGWNQPGNKARTSNEWNPNSTRVHGSPDTEKTLVGSPQLDQDLDKVIIVDDSYVAPVDAKERNAFTITIPLPWPSKRTHSRSSSMTTHIQPAGPPERDELERSPPLPSASPPIIYKPASETYVQELAKLGVYQSPSIGPWNFTKPSSSPPPVDTSRSHNISPITILSPVCEDFVKGVGDLGLSPSPTRTEISSSSTSLRSASPPVRAIENFSRPRVGSPPLAQSRIGSPSLSQSRVGSPPLPQHPDENRMASPPLSQNPVENRMGSPLLPQLVRYTSSAERPQTASGRYNSGERPGTSLSTRTAMDRPGTAMSSRSMYVGRSASRSRPEESTGTSRARSSSRGPGLDQTGYMRSSSREPARRRAESRDARGPGSRATSREPAGRRASSRGPAPSVRAPSRAASAGPVFRRPLERSPSTSSGSSSDTASIEDISPPISRKPSITTTVSSAESSGYYGGVKQEYTHLSEAGGIFSESEGDSYHSSGSNTTAREGRFEKLKKGIKSSPFLGSSEMVPDGEELWS